MVYACMYENREDAAVPQGRRSLHICLIIGACIPMRRKEAQEDVWHGKAVQGGAVRAAHR
jgi:hypothetical protein